MYVDGQTQRDLEILRARDGGLSILNLVDRTRTAPGARHLRFRVTHPLSDAAQITAAQDSVRFLAHADVPFTIDPNRLKEVESYLESSFTTLRRTPLLPFAAESIWVSLRYRDLLKHATNGVRSTRALVSQLTGLTDRLGKLNPPSDLLEVLENIGGIVDRLGPGLVPSSERAWRVLRADRLLRHRHRADLLRLLELVGELDALFAVASLLADEYTLPDVKESDEGFEIHGEGIWHPFLELAVRNPIAIRGGETLVFLTGPNMAGKTTYLKAVGICVYLAHCGLPVPAKKLTLTPLDGLFTSLSPEDNLRSGLSYFMAEVKRVRQVAEFMADGKRTLGIFDEVFRGTNVHDALDASRTVIRGCAGAKRSGFLFASHLVELTEDLAEVPSVKFFYFDGDIRSGRALFDYSLRRGVSDKRFGVELLKQEGVPELLAAAGS